MSSFDNIIYNYISSFNSEALTNIMLVITNFANAAFFIGLTIILYIVIKDKRIGKYISINLVVVFFLNQILKHIIARSRPEGLAIINESGYSFPSAHAMVSLGFYGFLIYIINKEVKSKTIRIICNIFFPILIIFIGISRVYLGVHYASDIIGGFLIATIYLLIFVNLIYKNNKVDKSTL